MNERHFPQPPDTGDFWRLVQASCDGTLLPAERDRLEAQLQSDAELKKQYVAYLGLHAELQWRFRGGIESGAAEHRKTTISPVLDMSPAVLPPFTEAGPSGFSQSRFSGFGTNWLSFAFLSLLAVVVGIAGTELWWHRKNTLPGGVQRVQVPILPAAFLTSANGCAWGGDATKTWTVGHSVEAGSEITLHEGIAEFRLANGGSLGVEGPASLLLVSPSKFVPQYGRFTAHVPWGSDEFKVVMAGCRFAAREADFGINLMGSKLEIHVFSGEVSAESSFAPGQDEAGEGAPPIDDDHLSSTVIAAGRALRLTLRGEVPKVAGWDKAVPAKFSGKLTMNARLPATKAYVDQVKASKPLGYWRFEEVVGSAFPNEIASGAVLQSLPNRDIPLLVGRNGNLSAEFRPNGNFGLKTERSLPIGKSQYSIELWIKPSHLHRGCLLGLNCNDGGSESTRLELQGGFGEAMGDDNISSLRFVQRHNTEEPGFGTSCYSLAPYAIRRWQHVVAVKSDSEMKLFLDGRLSASMKERAELPCDASLLVGFHSKLWDRRFVGQIDELAIYGRALPEKEIRQHYQTMKRGFDDLLLEEKPRRTESEPGDT